MVVVLFVCTGNAARSQMAEGWLKNLKSEFEVLSAGTKPEGVSEKAIKDCIEAEKGKNHRTFDCPLCRASYSIPKSEEEFNTIIPKNFAIK